MKCPNCGAELNNNKTCEFCGTKISFEMQRSQEQTNKVGCPQCHSSNIQFKRENQGEVRGKNSKQVVHLTVGFCKDCGYTWYPSGEGQQIPKKRRVWLWVLGWICIFPIPLTILLLRKKDLKPSIKYSIIVIAWLIYLAIGMSPNKDNNRQELQTNDTVIVTTVSSTPAQIETSTSTKDETFSPAIEDTNAQDKILKFVINPEEMGEYGFRNTLNEGTEFEETQIVYHIPAGTYSVTNLGDLPGQFQSCSDETIIADGGWEEPAKIGDVVAIKANGKAEFTIEEGYYLEVHLNGKLEFVQK